jgi:hypothetical protein
LSLPKFLCSLSRKFLSSKRIEDSTWNRREYDDRLGTAKRP